MANTVRKEIIMLEELILYASYGKSIEIEANPHIEAAEIDFDDRRFDVSILLTEFSGLVDGNPFRFVKSYSFTDETQQEALDSIITANSRLQGDYDRLEKVGISIEKQFFSFVDNFMNITMLTFVMDIPKLRLQRFVDLSYAGISVPVHVELKRPGLLIKKEDEVKKGYGCLASFSSGAGNKTMTIDKLYGIGCYDDTKRKVPVDIIEAADKRLERDCERLRNAGLKIVAPSFWYVWKKAADPESHF